MYRDHPNFQIDKTKGLPLWRYMDLWKFLDLLNSKQIYFPNFESLGDQHEGRIPESIFLLMQENEKKKGTPQHAENYKNMVEQLRPKTFNCSWISSKTESFAMWKMYAKEKLGVAIKTDFTSLMKSFSRAEEDIYIGEVSYYDNEHPYYETGNTFYSFLVKHNYYTFESEVRCIFEAKPTDPPSTGRAINVDLNSLIKEIYISPFAYDKGFVDIIEFLKQKNKLDFKVCKSGVNDKWL